jgi:hypothetical protein
VLDRVKAAPKQTEPFAHAHMIFRRSYQKGVLAGFAAKTQSPVVMADKAKLSPAVGTAVL